MTISSVLIQTLELHESCEAKCADSKSSFKPSLALIRASLEFSLRLADVSGVPVCGCVIVVLLLDLESIEL